MKTLFATMFAMLAFATGAQAEWKESRVLINKTTTAVDVQLNDTTVICSRADYAGDFLKILVPQLAGLTVIDHRNLNAGAPCVAAGECVEGNMPADILGVSSRPSDVLPITITMTRVTLGDTAEPSCYVNLEEAIEIPVRGKIFRHVRTAEIGQRLFSDCGL